MSISHAPPDRHAGSAPPWPDWQGPLPDPDDYLPGPWRELDTALMEGQL